MHHFATEQIEQSTNLADLKQLIGDNIDLLIECGFTKPISKIQLCDKAEIVQTVTLHKVVLASLAELTQFCDGLASWVFGKLSRSIQTFSLHSFLFRMSVH